MGDNLKMLTGRVVSSVFLSPDRTRIAFRFSDGSSLGYTAEGDCCSRSWIEHIENVGSLKGGHVDAVEPVDLGPPQQPNDDEEIKLYGVRLKIRGRQPVLVEFRNSSNGYYGGWLEPIFMSLDCLTELTEDF